MRGADGRLRSANEGTGIDDVWAEQKRIRLAEAIQENSLRTERKQRRKELLTRLRAKLGKLRKIPHKRSSPKDITLHLDLPKLKLPKFSKRQLQAGGLVLILVCLGLGGFVYAQRKAEIAKKDTSVKTQTLGKKVENPPYATVLPDGKSIDTLGGWQRVSPPDKEPVYAYVDAINGVRINVSQQPLPEGFKKDVSGSIAKLAESFLANEKIRVAGITAYVGTSAKGPQSVIFVKNELLVLMKSTQQIPNDYWGVYINSLR